MLHMIESYFHFFLQIFHLTKEGDLRWEELCVDLSDYRPGHRIMLEGCHGLGGTQEWRHVRVGRI